MATSTPARRRGVVAAASVATLLALAACSATPEVDDDAAAATDTGSSLLPPAEGTTSYPLTITTDLGEIVVEERPERLAVDAWDLDLMAVLGVTPVATDQDIDFYPWVLEEIPGEIETIWDTSELYFPPEAIAVTDPDLIISASSPEIDTLDQLTAIAPVLGAPEGSGWDSTWQDRIRLIGEVLDLSARAEEAIAEYDAYFEQIREEHPEFAGKTAAYLVFWGGEWGGGLINVPGSDSEVLLSQLGFVANPNTAPFESDDPISEELLGQIVGDVIVVVDQSGTDEIDSFVGNPLFQSLDAVQNGRLVQLTSNVEDVLVYEGEEIPFAGHFGRAWSVGPLSQRAVADLLVPILSGVLS